MRLGAVASTLLLQTIAANAVDEDVPGWQGGLDEEYRSLLRTVRDRRAATPYLVIDTQGNEILLRYGESVMHRASCATGSGRKFEGPRRWRPPWSFHTPKGRFRVLRKVADPLWIKPEWAFVEAGAEIPVFAEDPRRFQRGALGDYAIYFAPDFMIHGTLYEVNLGKSITHGCVRVSSDDLKVLYDRVEPGWPVYIY